MTTLRLSRIDDLTRRDHSRLEQEDHCYFFGEYTPREGFSFSETNGLVSDFKKPIRKKGKPEWKWKERAIREVAALFRKSIPLNPLRRMTLVPIPPSRARDDPEHDDRMLRALRQLGRGEAFDVRELILQYESTEAAHVSARRPGVGDLIDNYRINEEVAEPAPPDIALFDDVLTSGAHFKAAQSVLRDRYPGVSVVGIFIARRVIHR